MARPPAPPSPGAGGGRPVPLEDLETPPAVERPLRASDRLITPAVVCTVVVVAGVVVLAVVAAVVVLTLEGLDPDPMLKLTAQVGAGLAAVVNLWFTTAQRAQLSRVERHVGLAPTRHRARDTETPPA